MRKLILAVALVLCSFSTISSAPAPVTADSSVVCSRSDSETGVYYEVRVSGSNIYLVTLDGGKLSSRQIDVVTAIRVCNMQ